MTTRRSKNANGTEADFSDEARERIAALEQRVARLEGQRSPLMSTDDVADYLSVSTRTVDRIIDRGRLNPYWVRGQRRFTPEEVDKYLETYGSKKSQSANAT